MTFADISRTLEIFDLNKTQIDLSTIENRRFMYHSDGILILGAEDVTKRSRGLSKSHAEEYGEAEQLFSHGLPPFDEFVRGWIGVGKHSPTGIIHFAPHILSSCGPYFDTAFDFVEMTLKNGFNQQSVLRGFGEVWERPASDFFEKSKPFPKKPPLETQIQNAKAQTVSFDKKRDREFIPEKV